MKFVSGASIVFAQADIILTVKLENSDRQIILLCCHPSTTFHTYFQSASGKCSVYLRKICFCCSFHDIAVCKNTTVGKAIWQRLKEIKKMDLQFSYPWLTLHSTTFLRHFFGTSNLLSYFLVALQTFFGLFFRLLCFILRAFFYGNLMSCGG